MSTATTPAPICIRITEQDNVAIPTADVAAGVEIAPGVVTQQDIPQSHKITLVDIAKGEPVIRYGVVLGYAIDDLPAGSWVDEDTLSLPAPPGLDDLTHGVNIRSMDELPDPTITTWLGYPSEISRFAGTRNLLGIATTVQCVSGILAVAVQRMRTELLPKYPNVDGIVPIDHAYGCGVAIAAPEAKIPIRSLRNIAHHPNFGGEFMVVSLGCEKMQPDLIFDEGELGVDDIVRYQDLAGMDEIMATLLETADRKLAKLNERQRVELPLDKLCVGFQCGGSDAFSGVTANPSIGYASDMLVKGGATTFFSEVTEVRDAVHLLAERCVDAETTAKLADQMRWYDEYLADGRVDRSANPTPGNHAGGLSNIVEKAMGSAAKSGTAPIVDVVGPGEIPARSGLVFNATPASDFVCGASQLASGMGLQVFSTGRGTPYSLAAAPVIKISSRSELKGHWDDLIDINAGVIATGEKTIADLGTQLFELIIDVASGRKQPAGEKFGLANFLTIFNPAPIT